MTARRTPTLIAPALAKPAVAKHQARGSVLMVSLLIMIVLTLLVLAAMRGSTLMERLVGNSRQLDQAFQTTEAALRHGESLVDGALPDVITANGWYHYAAKPSPDWSTPTAWDAAGNGKISYSIDGANAQIAIEELPAVPDPGGGLNPTEQPQDSTVYRISARGYGQRGDTFVILQTTYRR
ncbi:type IV pilus assembly protein PilX [Lysobacter niastensis]|uniref:Type IV pilus assembly protein PilX n=1 Tax=Lysobacter niastensis TaxID=380629 RepID=A0ABU1WE86_9GAMM|nr:PilX N-terminal domain-containing pilus assembly protein [Lysobacter niastensis]MDR7135905.1 type IV pilus assembly protein PilX [Lysobacter niastensis]